MGNIIGIASTKKEIGKTTVALNLAATLSKKGKDVSLVDLDFYRAGLNTSLGIEDLPITIENVLNDGLHIREAEYKHITGLKIIPAKKGIRRYSINQLKNKIGELNSQVTILDSDEGKGLLSLLNIADSVIVVSGLDTES